MTSHNPATTPQPPVAITGAACLFPGAATPAQFWYNLVNGIDTTSEATAAQFGVDPRIFFDPTRRNRDSTAFMRGGYVTDAHDDSALDHPFTWSLYVAQQALADSGDAQRPHILARCGLILGNLSFPTRYSRRLTAGLYRASLERALGELLGRPDFRLAEMFDDLDDLDMENALISGQPASFVARMLGLSGPHFALDAACASSLYAVGLACQMLNSGRADLMLAGAVSGADPLFVKMGFTHFGAYPENGDSRPLDASSGGLISGEGAGMFVLKRYADALRDGDRIYALIDGVGLSNDGRGKHPLTPNPRGQMLAFQRAYAASSTAPSQIQAVECHASGTPVGDKTEINSLAEFFGAHQAAPLLGSVKSNHGHLLTAAGMASMLKIVLSMNHNLIPATLNVRQPMQSQNGLLGAAQIVTRNTPWPNPSDKRAGVDAFGFGGVSAHLILRDAGQPTERPDMEMRPAISDVRLAITGMEAQFGGCADLDALAAAIYEADTANFRSLPPKRWKGLEGDTQAPRGAYMESFDIDFMRFKFPPKQDDQPIPQQLLLLKVADQAARDAGLIEGANVAVIVALGTEMSLHQYTGRLDLSWQIRAGLEAAGVALSPAQAQSLEQIAKDALNPVAQVNQYTSFIGNIVSSRVSALWDFTGPAFTLSSEENSAFKALEVAQMLLADGAVDAVIVGAVDLAGGFEHVALRAQMSQLYDGAPSLSFDQAVGGWMIGEGAAAVVLKRADQLTGERVYAYLDGLAIVQRADDDAEAAVSQAAYEALGRAGRSAGEIGYLEAAANGFAEQDRAEIFGLNAVYRGTPQQTALGSVKTAIGHTFAAAGLAGVVKAALCLYQRIIPATPNWTTPKYAQAWAESNFYVPQDSRAWFSRADARRAAAVSSLGVDGGAGHLILSEGDHDTALSALKQRAPYLLLIDADHQAGLLGRLGQLESALADGEALEVTAARAHNVFRNKAYVLALVAHDRDGLRKEIESARRGIAGAFESGVDWHTPAGSALSPRPAGQTGGVAFVYPGGFNSYPGLGQDWLHLFPPAHDHLLTLTGDPARTVADRLIYPRSLNPPSRAEVRAFRARLADDQVAMMESGTTFAVLFTYVMREIFRVKPSAALGYSLGEGSMMWAMGVWRDGDTAGGRFAASPLFRTRLFGRKEAVREAWGLPDAHPDDFWASYVISTPHAVVAAQVATESRVYITHINTPSETVIAGEPAACERVIAGLGGGAVRAPFEVVIHNETMLSEYPEFYRLHLNALSPAHQEVLFYSAADYGPTPLDSAAIARNIARVSCKPVDFPRLVNRAYRDGARVFIELGPGITCARWVSDTLGDLPHLAASIDSLRADDHTALVKLLARLAAHRVPMDLSPLYADLDARSDERRASLRRIVLGGDPVRDIILSEANRARFASIPAGQPARVTALDAQSAVPSLPPLPAIPPVASSGGHGDVLGSRLGILRQLGAGIQSQLTGGPAPAVAAPVFAPPPASTPIVAARPRVDRPPARFNPRPAIFTRHDIETFSTGSIKACFGEEYAIYDGRRAPRIPNTDLLFVSRVVEVNATRIITQTGSSMVMEYDVPADEWFYRENSYPYTPYSILMEMALQPCGFLSAFMGPTLAYPEIDFYFRNLDGNGKLLSEVDLRGRTLVNRVELLSSTTLQGIIIQKYSFAMSLDGEPFYVGQSTFGYFTLQALSSQAGLDMGKPPQKWHEAHPDAPLRQVPGNRELAPPADRFLTLPPQGKLAFLNDAQLNLTGGDAGLGYIYARSRVSPTDWFLACHFHQDPVMPGSLGLEAISQAIQLYAIEARLGDGFAQPRFANAEGEEMIWKYRGQVLGDSAEVNVEVQITGVERQPDRIVVKARASLWKGALRIYEFKNVSLAILEA
jgi:PfaB family protein